MQKSQHPLSNEAGSLLYKKLLSDRNKAIDELENTHKNLMKHIPTTPCTSKATLAFTLLEDLINECMHDVLLDAHQDIKKEGAICQICQTKCKHYVRRPGVDIWGKSYTVNNLPAYECVNCQKSIASTRYAPHLEKCLGLAGRQSSRVASRRMGNSPFSSDDTASPESSHEDRIKKKNKYPPSSFGVSRVKKLKYSE